MKRKFEEIDNSFIISGNDKCPICLETLQDKNLTITKCGHKFCHTCLDEHSYKDSACPICRTDMETKTKINSLCDCDINHSVKRALNESIPHLNNLNLRIEKKFLNLFENLDLKLDDSKSKEEINNLRKDLCKKLYDNQQFKLDISRFLNEEIFHFSMVKSITACRYLKDISEL